MSSGSLRAFSGLVRISRPMVQVLFLATCLLSVVSFYTTQQGMKLYLSPWFALLASLGVQTALLLVAWMVGLTRSRRALLIGVYVITAVISIAFSYASLFTWFSDRERPAVIQRRLYDSLSGSGGRIAEILTGAVSEQQKHVLALEQMTQTERETGFVSRSGDADPYLAAVREAVALEARSFEPSYGEGVGAGLRYQAFERHTGMARQSLERLRQSQSELSRWREGLRPDDPAEKQLREFRLVYDSVPWQDVRESLHAARLEQPAVPAYSDFVDRTASGQEDLLVAFQELVTAPAGRHVFAFVLAAFIDIIIFLLAYASGPYFFGAAEQRWIAAAAALDSASTQVFVRNFLRKIVPGASGLGCVEAAALTPGEQQLCLQLVARDLAAQLREEGRIVFLLDREIHEQLLESLAEPGISLRAEPDRAAL